MAVKNGIEKFFFANLNSVHVRICSNNVTTVTYINCLGGTRSVKCHKVAKLLWEWALEMSIHISTEHIPRKKNVLADAASRGLHANTEWSIADSSFQTLSSMLGPFYVDLFGSKHNAKLSILFLGNPKQVPFLSMHLVAVEVICIFKLFPHLV